ncbi:sulfate/molybdate ABC transporter ATP-binding protein [Silvimonas amylolytica]|uniref:Sulfate/thiosulfate import ATP-binding protein CysA 2 n=1 Tax=Silvimonas amylolytica TaxID=449663 RepID=A0ABQ2PJX5_9NEIS|nr:sulfate ABC transporter ATP-binding protein [Silvimonas amylolytica]GGP25910.1 sulfate/thiosulfate import ATP-binding protein CysA 2 [Silvimonas amylolytica]
MSIEIRNIAKRFGNFTALDNINLEVKTGELLALLGPSGCGKTTLLRIIAGLETPDDGQILFHGEDTTEKHVRERNVGFVFQHYALFRHMTVFENVAFGLRVRPRNQRPSEEEIKKKVHDLLNLVQLDWLADRYPAQLSGGQRQRIALARALAVEPKVLLLDEPFGALDTKVRKELRRWLRRLHDEMHITSVFVTHDQEEALEVADRVVVMNKGKIEQLGSPTEVYDKPATPFVYQFLGDVNLFHSRVHEGWAQVGDTRFAAPESVGDKAMVYVRPHEIDLVREAGPGALQGTIQHIRLLGATVRLELDVADQDAVEVELTREQQQIGAWQVGESVYLQPREARVYIPEHRAATPTAEWSAGGGI